MSRFSFSSPFSSHTADSSIPQDSMPIMALGGQVGDGDQCLSNQFFRLIVSVDTGEDGAVGAGAVIQSEL